MANKERSASKSLIERDKQKQERDLSDIRFVAKTPEGRRLMWRILSRAGIFQMDGYNNAIDSARFSGRRNNGIELLNDIMAAKPSLFGQMQQEYASELKREEIEKETEIKEGDPLSLDN